LIYHVISFKIFGLKTKEFYHFANLISIQQPDKTNWCWAICFEVLAKQFVNTSLSSMNACNFVLDYLSYTNKKSVKENFCEVFLLNTTEIPDWGDVTINEEKHLVSFLENYGIKIEKQRIEELDNNELFKLIIELLFKKGLPLLTKKSQGVNSYSHLRLITGYGIYKGCNYVLLMDSLLENEVYMPISVFRETLSKIWIATIDEKIELPKLVEDIDTKNELIHFENLISVFNNSREFKANLNPVLFLQQELDFLRFGFRNNFDTTVDKALEFLVEKSGVIFCNAHIPKNKHISKIAYEIPPVKLEEIEELLEKMRLNKINGGLFLLENAMVQVDSNRDSESMDDFNFEILAVNNEILEKTITVKSNKQLKQQIINHLK